MKTVDDLLCELRQRDVQLWLEGDRLRYRAAKDSLTPEVLTQLKAQKAEIIAFLQQVSAVTNSQLPPVVPVERKNNLPLSFAQQRLWFLHQFEPDSSSNNMPVVVRFTGKLNVAALEQSLTEVVRRHEVLRTTFPAVDGHPTQAIATDVSLTLPLIDLQNVPAEDREAEAYRLATEEAHRPFDLANGPILRVKLLRLGDQEHLLVWNLHCIVCDGASSDVFYQDLTAVYAAFSAGKPSPLPDLPVQYADFAHWQHQWLQGEVLESQLNYWKHELEGHLPLIQLPYDHPRPLGIRTYRGDRGARMLSTTLNTALTNLSQQLGGTLFMTLLAAFETLLYRYSGQTDLLISFASAGRGQVETERLIGFFSNTLMLRTNFEGNPTFRELLNRVRKSCLEAFSYQDLPFEKLIEELRPEQSQNRSPLFQVKFALNPPWSHGRGMASVGLPDLTITSLFGYIYHGKTKYDLTLVMREQDEGLGMVFDYNAELFDASTITRMLTHFERLLEGIVANPNQCISDLPLLTAAEQDQFLEGSSIPQDYPGDAGIQIHQLFEAQAQKTPDSVAIVGQSMGQDKQLTYRDLNCRANQLAHYLQTLGVQPEVPVALYMERSIEAIVGLLGILKAGGTYVLLDSAASSEHLAFVLEDAQVSIVLTQQQLLEALHPYATKVVDLDADWEIIAQQNQDNPVSPTMADLLASIQYSYPGNLSKPRGFGLSHRSIVQLATSVDPVTVRTTDVVLQYAPLSGDAATFEIWGSLLNGAKLVIAPAGALSFKQLGQVIRHYCVTMLQLPTRLFHRMVDEQLENLQSVRQLLTGGDFLSIAHVRKFRQQFPDCDLINTYSLPENAGLTCAYPVPDLTQIKAAVPIGRAIGKAQVYVLDRNLQLVPPGVPGELHIGGDRLTRRYLNHSTLTATKFIPDPFSPGSDSFLYKTGDLGRYLPDGTLERLGSIEDQMKMQGFPVEQGRIEAALAQHPAVRESVALVQENEAGESHLVAYIVLDQTLNQTPLPPFSELQGLLKKQLPLHLVPSILIALDSLPLNSDREIDLGKLPAPDSTSQETDNLFVAARNDVELKLALIWEKVLGVQSIGIQDNFFDLGGHSLLAVRLFAQIEETFNQKLPLSTLLQAPTIEQLAQWLHQSDSSEIQESLVPLRSGHGKPPLFFIHDGDGETMLYLNLVRQLSPEHPVYGIQPYRRKGYPILHTRIREMVAYYIEKMRSIQPEGPYLVGGLCAGGVLAFEIARQIQRQGQKVALVALIDVGDVQAPERVGRMASQRLNSFAEALKPGSSLNPQKQLLPKLKVMAQKISNLVTYEAGLKIQTIQNKLKLKLFRHYLDHNLPLPTWLQDIPVRTIYFFAKREYAPDALYPDEVVLFRATAGEGDDEPSINLYSDPLLGWGKRVTQPVKVYDIPGGHSSMLQEPNAQVLAEKMQTYIDVALSKQAFSS
jgi:aspartate racemase